MVERQYSFANAPEADFNSSNTPHKICGSTRDAQFYSTMCIELTILTVTMLSVIVYLRWTVGAALLSILACKHDETAPLFESFSDYRAGECRTAHLLLDALLLNWLSVRLVLVALHNFTWRRCSFVALHTL
jgi:hypothetical protein